MSTVVSESLNIAEDPIFTAACELALGALLDRGLAPSRALADCEDEIRLVAVHLLRVLAIAAFEAALRHGEATEDIVAGVMRASAETWNRR